MKKVDDNFVGSQDSRISKVKAEKALSTAKDIEESRIASGWVWLSDGSTSKLVHPDKVDYYKYTKGFRYINTTHKH